MALSQEQNRLLEKHLELVLEANESTNLTRIDDWEAGKVLHIEDSLEAVKDISSKDNIKNIVDLGSGSGFPGIPLSIATGITTTLVETVRKKADWLKYFVFELNLENQIFVSNKRIEEHSKEKCNFYDIATARALSSLSSLLELASPLLKINGFFIAYKGKDVVEEINCATNIQEKFGFKLIVNRSYTLSNNTEHRIIVFQKYKNSSINLPRKYGFAQKKPFQS